MVAKFRGLAEQVAVVGGERLRAVEEQSDAHVVEYGKTFTGRLVDRGEVVPVLVELHERPVSGDAGHAERLGHWFEGPDHESAGLLLDVDAVVGVAQHRQARGQIGDRFGH